MGAGGDRAHPFTVRDRRTVGATLTEAYDRARMLEWLCQVFVHASSAGTPWLLEADQRADVRARMTRLRAERDAAPGWRNR